jgi:signal transduction histidine kinase
MGKVIRSMNWSETPLGSIDSWPQSLRTTVSLCLASNFPISLAWGPKSVQIYNDGYWPICGGKHPGSMGQDFRECWASAWPAIGEAFDRALTGETSFLENQRMFLDRNGYLEETFFTFSFSPIRDESGGVGGLFHPVTETTQKMLGERRTRTLRDLAAQTGKAQTTEEALVLAAQTLKDFELDLPFVLFYLLDPGAKQARLIASAGSLPPHLASATVDLQAEHSVWPLAEVARSSQLNLVEGLDAHCSGFQCGPYPNAPKTALVFPITPPGCEGPIAILVAGVSSRLPLDELYRGFFELVNVGVGNAVANARAYQQERERADALAEIDRAKTAFFSNVSHEFRTPLTLMLGPLEDELAERASPLPPDRRERLETAHRNALRLLKLVNTLLDFARIEAGRIHASYEPTELASYTAELSSVFRAAIEKAGLTLTVDCPLLPELVYIDKEMWEKVVLNLLSNAVKHTFEGGIRVALSWRGDHVELAVADSGVGIPAVELPRVFERFHRIKGTKSRTHEGTGIGLALVQEVIRAHRGTVRLESTEGRGTTFLVSVPTGNAHLPSDRLGARASIGSTVTRAAAYVEEALHWISDLRGVPAPEPSPPAVTEAAGSARAHILWADDNADMREYVRRLLTGRYRVTAVADGLEALAAARADPPDLVLSDVMMPGLDGFGLLRELRAEESTRVVPVILLSARAGEESALEGLEAGADDYLIKPFSARELLARVRTHLQLSSLRREWAEELERANEELKAFSYSVSHDLRAPLRAIEGFSGILLEDHSERLDAEGQDCLRRVRAATKRMGALIDDMLKLARIDRAPLRTRRVDLSDLASQVAEVLRKTAPQRQVEILIQPHLEAEADPGLLEILLMNVIGNAWKFTSKMERATIKFGSIEEGGSTVFFVEDNGVGFDPVHDKKLFGPFQRLHSEAEFPGTGIGLATVERIVRRHRGRVWAKGAVGKGATLYWTCHENGSKRVGGEKETPVPGALLQIG